MTPDADLVAAARTGDREAFATLAERYRGRVYATALTLLRNEEDARDVAQETFLRAFRGIDQLSEPEKFGSWAVGIAAHASRDVRRRRGIERGAIEEVVRRRIEARQVVIDAARKHAIAVAKPLESGGLDADLEKRLTALLGALPEQARRALRLRYEGGLSYKEIAREMSVPESTVRGILHRATAALRNRMRPYLTNAPAEPAKRAAGPAKGPVKRRASGRRPRPGSARRADAVERSGADSEEVVK